MIPEELINANQKFESKVEATNISENAPSAAIRRWSPKYGLSLNEAILGTTKSQNNLQGNFPSFDLLGKENEEPFIENNEEAFVKSFVNCSELIHNENYFPIQAVPNYVGQSSNSQTIFPTAMEHKFYSLLVSNISKITYRLVVSCVSF